MSFDGALVSGGIARHGSPAHSNSGVNAGPYGSFASFQIDSAGCVTKAYNAWAADFAYPANQVVLGSDSKLYRAVLSNTGNDPTLDNGTNWVRVSVPQKPGGTPDNQTLFWDSAAGEFKATTLVKIDVAGERVLVGNPAFPNAGTGFQVWDDTSAGTSGNVAMFTSNSASGPSSIRISTAGTGGIDYWIAGVNGQWDTGCTVGDAGLRLTDSTKAFWLGAGNPTIAYNRFARFDANGLTLGGSGSASARLDSVATTGQPAGKFTGVASQPAVSIGGSTGTNTIAALEVSNDVGAVGRFLYSGNPSSAGGSSVFLFQGTTAPNTIGYRLGSLQIGVHLGTGFSCAAFAAYAEENMTGGNRGAYLSFQTNAAGGAAGLVERARITSKGNFLFNPAGADLGTGAADGFPYLPTMNGAPTGTPTSYTGSVPMVYDRSNKRRYLYDGGWRAQGVGYSMLQVVTYFAPDLGGTYTVAAGDGLILVDTSGAGGSFANIALPLASANPGRVITVKHLIGTPNCTISRAGSDTIDGATSLNVAASARATLASDGVNQWYRID